MSTATPAAAPQSSSGDPVNPWARSIAKVTAADSLSPSEVSAIWQKMYRAAQVTGESGQRDLRMAVYINGLVNGTSREGEYGNTMVLANGRTVPASIIPLSCGKMQIRKFYRGNMDESYEALKSIDMSEHYPRVVTKAAAFGIASKDAFAIADWLGDCPRFVPSETLAHERHFSHSVDRSRRARGGNTLETVEDARLEHKLDAQGPSSVDGGKSLSF